MSQLKSIFGAGWLKDIADNFAALAPIGTVYGNGIRRTARAVFDTAIAANRAVGAHGTGISIPANAIIIGGVVEVNTAFTGEANAALAIGVNSGVDIVASAAVNGVPWSTTGQKAIIPKNNTPESTSIKVSTAAKEITVTVGSAALLTGKMNIYLDYYEGDATE